MKTSWHGDTIIQQPAYVLSKTWLQLCMSMYQVLYCEVFQYWEFEIKSLLSKVLSTPLAHIFKGYTGLYMNSDHCLHFKGHTNLPTAPHTHRYPTIPT